MSYTIFEYMKTQKNALSYVTLNLDLQLPVACPLLSFVNVLVMGCGLDFFVFVFKMDFFVVVFFSCMAVGYQTRDHNTLFFQVCKTSLKNFQLHCIGVLNLITLRKNFKSDVSVMVYNVMYQTLETVFRHISKD